jgi:hypothetical protein
MESVRVGEALHLCIACDALWTALERIEIHPTAIQSIHQRPVIERFCPEFVTWFKRLTADVDFGAVASTILEAQKSGSKKRKRAMACVV